MPPSYLVRLRRALPVLRVFVLILCIVALARPQWGVEATKVHKQGIAIDMVVDVSRSMEALERQRDGRRATILSCQGGVARFCAGEPGAARAPWRPDWHRHLSRYADSVCPLTLDHDLLLALLDQVDIVTIPEENGTAIGEAMALGVERYATVLPQAGS